MKRPHGRLVVLSRHAQALPRSSWVGDDGERPLSERGTRQAEGFARLIEDWEPLPIVSSPAVRCVDTVQPLAKLWGTDVVVTPSLGEGRGVRALPDLLVASEQGVVANTHGDVLPELLDAIAAELGLTLPSRVKWPKGCAFVISGGKHGAIRYVEPQA